MCEDTLSNDLHHTGKKVISQHSKDFQWGPRMSPQISRSPHNNGVQSGACP